MKITKLESKVSGAGKPYKVVDLEDANGVYKDKLAFPSFSQFESMEVGSEIECELNDKFINDPKGLKPKKNNFTNNMEVKAQNIAKAQENKELSIQISSTARDATLIVTTFYKDLTDEEIKVKWLEWREWLSNNFDPREDRKLNSNGDPVPFSFPDEKPF